ncbi:cytochrome b561 family protein [Mycolicibacterium phlei]|uniref:cytochrome b n=1 Tax=Mycobacteroides chelonae TaxID=1774 RepID=UPI000618CEDF|nr:cytochrome b/b6 domain-containing protein [Mycobacteroides chelonae]VEG16038.1 cytochrome b561 family protein [Mycolicibacterium phlei]AKC38679.1 cytochrome B561 [Mycobacteroides chelonae]ANA97930.1 cytochrome B561 [Mycobacteroides chelonae CCUG 47445]OLT78105.1 cytochrome B [Mycobacteroides chelonae]ORV15049.1 cytochrome B [Mycobacteroides chelonae]
MTESTGAERFGLAAQLLHWLMAVSIITMLVLGALLVGSLGDYPMVLAWHKAVGVVVLVLAVLRVGNRIWHKPPPLSLAQPERFIAAGSELAMYTLFLAQPVIGWALVSASGVPVEIAGLRFPSIVPTSIGWYGVLREAHAWVAYALLGCIVAHVSAVLFHTIGLRDGLLARMLPRH